MQSLFILGRQPAIGRAELESLLGASHMQPIGDHAVLSDIAPSDIDFARLGSTIKLASYLDTIQDGDWRRVQDALPALVRACAEQITEGKVQLGLSAYGMRVNPQQLLAAGLNLKKSLRAADYSVRLIPNQEIELSSAQVLHNHLAGERGIEVVLIKHGPNVIVGRTVAVQDITAYARRDQGRPKRDAFVGMLPPKLAQTIINLGVAQLPASPEHTVLDPFCGTGVVLQEARLMGFRAEGADLEQRMVDYSIANMEWLTQQLTGLPGYGVAVGDATMTRWRTSATESKDAERVPLHIDAVASEVYLGHPLTNWPRPEKLQQIIGTCNVIIEKFLRNIAGQTAVGARLCLAVPAWKHPDGKIYHLPLLDHLEKMGYNRVSFEHARAEELVYYRPDQLVARELLVITRK